MLRPLGGLAAIILFGASTPPQELKSEALDKLKAATVHVLTVGDVSKMSGTGFLFLKRDGAGYIITCKHVLAKSSTAKVVFHAGTPQEKVYPARVVARDLYRDLACLIVKDAPDLPSPLIWNVKTAVKESDAVIIAGFERDSTRDQEQTSPPISIAKATVTSIQRNREGDPLLLQMSGHVNPGFGGAPVVSVAGLVVGVNACKGASEQTQAVPPEGIEAFLKGGSGKCELTKSGGSATEVRYEAVLRLVNPLGTLKGAGFAYINEDEIKDEPTPSKDGTWPKVHPDLKVISLKIDEEQATGLIELTRNEDQAKGLVLICQSYHILENDQTIWSEPATFHVKFDGNPATPEKTDAPDRPAAKDVALALPDELTPTAEIKINSVIANLQLTPDGSALFALDLSEGQLYKIDPDNLAILVRIDVIESPVAMAMSPNGKTLYVASRSGSITKEGPNGAIQVISTDSLKTTSSFDLMVGPTSLVASDSGLLMATSVWGEGGSYLVVIDSAKKSTERAQSIFDQTHVRLNPNQNRVYYGSRERTSGDFRAFNLRKEKDRYVTYEPRNQSDRLPGGDFEITPDGRYLISCGGTILRLAKTREGDMAPAGHLDPCLSMVMTAGCSTLFTATESGFCKSYDLGDFSLTKSANLGLRCFKLALDVGRRKLFAVVGKLDKDQLYYPVNPRVGRIVSFSLGSK